MNLVLNRQPSNDVCTHGDLYVGDFWECVTLEDPVRIDNPLTPQNEGKKIFGETAIPAGRYRVIITESDRVKKGTLWSPNPPYLPLLLDVPDFTGIRFHALNRAKETLGCIGVGKERGPDFISKARIALTDLMPKIQKALDYGDPVYINIHNAKEVTWKDSESVS